MTRYIEEQADLCDTASQEEDYDDSFYTQADTLFPRHYNPPPPPQPHPTDRRYKLLKAEYAEKSDTLAATEQKLRTAVEGCDRATRDASRKAAQTKLLKTESVLYQRELKKVKSELAALQESHHDALLSISALRKELHTRSLEIQDSRARELTSLRESVAQSVRNPIRNASRSRGAKPNPKPGKKEKEDNSNPKNEAKMKKLVQDIAAVTCEVETLRKQNTALCSELEACNSDKDRYVELLMNAGVASAEGGDGAVSVAAAGILLGRIQGQLGGGGGGGGDAVLTKLQTNLRALLSLWDADGVESLEMTQWGTDVDAACRGISVETHRLSTLQKLFATYNAAG